MIAQAMLYPNGRKTLKKANPNPPRQRTATAQSSNSLRTRQRYPRGLAGRKEVDPRTKLSDALTAPCRCRRQVAYAPRFPIKTGPAWVRRALADKFSG